MFGQSQSIMERSNRILLTRRFLVRDGVKTKLSDVERAVNRETVVGKAGYVVMEFVEQFEEETVHALLSYIQDRNVEV